VSAKLFCRPASETKQHSRDGQPALCMSRIS